MNLLAHDPFVSPTYAQNLEVELTSMKTLLQRSDFITIHTPLGESTKDLIGKDELSLIKQGGHIINVARGGIVNEEALYQAVENGKLAGAAVDVFTQEPLKDSNLLKSQKIIVTPHLGASTKEAQGSASIEVAEQVLAVLDGKSPRYAVNAPLMVPEALPLLAPFLDVGGILGKLAPQLGDGQMNAITIHYQGEISNFDTSVLRAAVIRGLLHSASEERINSINADLLASQRGLKIHEEKSESIETYTNLLSIEVSTSSGSTLLAGTSVRGQVHLVRVNDYWIDVAPTDGWLLFVDHQDRPGMIGRVGTITGNANVNISFVMVGRLKARGAATMILGLDDPLPESVRQDILKLPGIQSARLAKL